ncbi:MAG: hypothetical protein H0X39_20400, partial [Actinobacteria bacterium]|nr:hypothetical protein [Actinomycetota bacterium]
MQSLDDFDGFGTRRRFAHELDIRTLPKEIGEKATRRSLIVRNDYAKH